MANTATRTRHEAIARAAKVARIVTVLEAGQYDLTDPDLIAGMGTDGWQVLEQLADVHTCGPATRDAVVRHLWNRLDLLTDPAKADPFAGLPRF